MERLKDKLIYSTLGAGSGLAGIFSLSRCPGSACVSCLGCAGIGAGILILALLRTRHSLLPK
ncbi:MAG: hypothetical protein HY756_03640 [Nitrospirae bacterium]|nr:hypothetical protein [Nitrospirota bacterium]